MATATKIHISSAKDTGIYGAGVREDAAQTASEVLQEDMAIHHVYLNGLGHHNHIVHHVLSIYALGGSPDDIRAAYKRNKIYQRPALPANEGIIREIYNAAKFQDHLGNEENYPNFLAYFQREIDAKGVEDVLNQYLFAMDERAESLLVRLYAGLFHPLIHLGFGLEFNQPAIVAQALAQAAVHDDQIIRAFLLPAEMMACKIGKPGDKSLLQILNDVRTDKTLTASLEWTYENKIQDGILARASEQMIKHAAEFTVSEDQMEVRLADMINTVVYYTSAAQRPSKEIALDFFFVHCVNSSIFFSTIMNLQFLDQQFKIRLLEWKGRLDLLMYAACGAPELLLHEVTTYPAKDDWNTLFSRSIVQPDDDGHVPKLVRAVAHGQRVCLALESRDSEKLPISGDMWLKIGNMAVNSAVQDGERPTWIRSTGFDEAWENFKECRRL